MSKRLVGLLVAALCPLAALAQEAQAAPPAALVDPTIHRHKGFFIRPELGFGYFGASASQGGVTLKVSGGGAALGLAIGGAVSEDFIVAGQVWDYVVSEPTVSMSGGGFDFSGTATDGSAGLVGYGVLLNWYFMPGNWYAAVTPSLTRIVTSDGTSDFTSEWGFGVRGAFGKEWWVSDHWGLGLAASLALSSNKDAGTDPPTFTTFCAGLTFSATYN
jgi:hypothetical protein